MPRIKRSLTTLRHAAGEEFLHYQFQGHALRARQAGAEPGQISCTDAEITRRNRELERWDAA